mgnify:CR=1 FL=1
MAGILTDSSQGARAPEPEPAGGFWTEPDREAVSDLVDMIRRVERHAFETGDRALIGEAHHLVSGLVQLYDLLVAFRNSPDGRIKGPQGVAKKLSLTRNGVYCRLEMVGLDPENLRDPDSDVLDLVARSRILGPLAERMREVDGSI